MSDELAASGQTAEPGGLDAVLQAAYQAQQAGQWARAEAGYRHALAHDPDHFHANVNLALILHGRGAYDEAERLLETAQRIDPTEPAVLNNLGAVYLARGRLEQAETAFRRILALKPEHVDASSNLGEALVRQGRIDEGLERFRAALRIDPNHVNARAGLGQALWRAGECDLAYRETARAAALAPFHAPLDNLLQNMQTAGTRAIGWHFPMLNDARRNAVYRKAIERHVKPGMLVLEIGCGAGLLSMLAARAGAQVVTFEVMPDLAAVAREIVAANGLAERIAVVEKFSFLGQVGVDLPRPADLLVTEIFDAALLGEEVLRSVRHAREALLQPDARVVPGGARLYAQLVESERLGQRMRVDEVEGFDMSIFNRFAPRRMLVEDMRIVPHRTLSEPIELFRFDFDGRIELAGQAHQTVEITADGQAAGFMIWFELEMDGLGKGGPSYGSAPSDGSSHWSQRLQLLERLRPVRAGESLRVEAEFLRSAIFVDVP
jgi:tetratricopeptide (TPR) repeat protein